MVAIFANALQTFATFFDIGSAAYDGFDEHLQETRHPDLREPKFIVGMHEAGIRKAHGKDIGRAKGEPPINEASRMAGHHVPYEGGNPSASVSVTTLLVPTLPARSTACAIKLLTPTSRPSDVDHVPL